MVFRKKKKINTLDNLHEIIKIAQKVYELKWGQKISVEKVRFLYDFLFEQIIQSVNKKMRVNIYNFGSFNKVYYGARENTDPSGNRCRVDPYYKIQFKAGRELKKRINLELTAAKEDEPKGF